MASYISVISIVVMFYVEWYIRKPWSSSIMLYNNNIIAHNRHTHNNPYIFLHLYISTSTMIQHNTGRICLISSVVENDQRTC